MAPTRRQVLAGLAALAIPALAHAEKVIVYVLHYPPGKAKQAARIIKQHQQPGERWVAKAGKAWRIECRAGEG